MDIIGNVMKRLNISSVRGSIKNDALEGSLGCVGEEKNDTDLRTQLSLWRAHADSQMILELSVLCFIGSQDKNAVCLFA